MAQHVVRRYVQTDGESGHKWHRKDTLLLTARGRKSGKLRDGQPVEAFTDRK